MDGGSSVAVLTYLRQILEALDHPDMINLILHYLLGLPDIVTATPDTANSVSKARKRKSLDLAHMMAAKSDEAADPLLYTLVDLILACLHSPNHQTIHVTLQLVSAIIKRHHRYAVTTLVRTENLYGDLPHRTIGAQQQELEFLMALAGTIGGQDNFNSVYENILRDTTARVESHPCSLKLTVPKISLNNHKSPFVPDSLPGAPRDVREHTIRPDDPLLEILLDHLDAFFVNPVETNLGITETLFDLALCGYMNLEGWLLRHPDKYIYDAEDAYQPPSPRGEEDDPLDNDLINLLSDDPDKIDQINKCRRRPTWALSSLPRLLRILQTLANQVDAFRETIPRFNDLLQQRRESFQTADSASILPRRSQPPVGTPAMGSSSMHTSRSGSPTRAGGLEGFAQRILKDLNELGAPSRPSSPRGHNLAVPGGPPMTGFGLSSPPSSSKGPPVPPKEFPLSFNAPSRPPMGRPYSSGGLDAGGDSVTASQAAAFQAVDQQILARKVGLPANKTNEPPPLELGGIIEEEDEAKEQPSKVDDDGRPPTPPAKGLDDDAGGNERPPTPPAKDSATHLNVKNDPLPIKRRGRSDTIFSIMTAGPITPLEERKVTISHVLTNVVVLQSFLFELAALVQVRAGLFDEVRFA